MMGIDIDRVIVFTFILGSALAGAAGVMFALRVPTNVSIGFVAGLKGFIAAVIGGIGSVPGRDGRRPDPRARSSRTSRATSRRKWSDLVRLPCPDRVHALPPPGPPRPARHPEGMSVATRRRTGSIRRAPKARRSGRTSGSRVTREQRFLPRAARRPARAAPAARAVVGVAHAVRRGVLPLPGRRVRAATSGRSRSRRCSTCCSRSGSTSSSAGAGCSTSATSRSTASAPTRTRCSTRRTTASTCRRSSRCR